MSHSTAALTAAPAGSLARLWDWLTRPHPRITDEQERTRARLVSTMLVVVIGIGGPILSYFLIRPDTRDDLDTLLVFAAWLLIIGLYGVQRSGRTRLAAGGLIALVIAALGFTPFLPEGNINIFYYAFLAVLLTATLFRMRHVAAVMGVLLVGQVTVALLLPESAHTHQIRGSIRYFAFFLLQGGGILLALIHHNRELEGIRRRELEAANAALRESEALLERRVIERTAELEKARLAAEQANATKSRFLANMSHELRTPLNAILNFTEFVADGIYGEVNEQQENALRQTLHSGEHLLSLINDVLDLTKIEAGMVELFVEEVDLNAVLASVIAVGKGLVKDKPIRLISEVEALPITHGDKRRLRQVFLNVLSNAVKFTREGEIVLTARPFRDGVIVIVKDTGVGIAPEDHDKVFESFKQAKHDLTGAVGTGLGMPISRYFVEMHNGQIWFESQPDLGTTFYITLPTLTAEQAGAMAAALRQG